jgi:hypothetical protein
VPRDGNRLRIGLTVLFVLLFCALALYRTFNPSPADLVAIADNYSHPWAAGLGSVAPAFLLSPVVYWGVGRALRRYNSRRKKCEHCAKFIGADAAFCSHCGRAAPTAISGAIEPLAPAGESEQSRNTSSVPAFGDVDTKEKMSGPSIGFFALVVITALVLVVLVLLLGTLSQPPEGETATAAPASQSSEASAQLHGSPALAPAGRPGDRVLWSSLTPIDIPPAKQVEAAPSMWSAWSLFGPSKEHAALDCKVDASRLPFANAYYFFNACMEKSGHKLAEGAQGCDASGSSPALKYVFGGNLDALKCYE